MIFNESVIWTYCLDSCCRNISKDIQMLSFKIAMIGGLLVARHLKLNSKNGFLQQLQIDTKRICV